MQTTTEKRKNGKAKVKPDDDVMDFAGQEVNEPEAVEPVNYRPMWDEITSIDGEIESLESQIAKLTAQKSELAMKISKGLGSGPFKLRNGRIVTIRHRKGPNGTTYFFVGSDRVVTVID